jgi:hypothetical protein
MDCQKWRETSMPFFADTNICSKWESDSHLKRNWEITKANLEAQGQHYVSSPLVLIELLSGLVKPEPDYFISDLKRFAFLAGQSDAKFIDFPGAFVLKTVLNIDSPATNFKPTHFKQWLDCILAAPSREALSNGDVEMNGSRLISYGIDFNVNKQQHEEGKSDYAKRMTQRRAEGDIPQREYFAADFLIGIGINRKRDEDLSIIAEALDAAYEYEKFLLTTAPKYDYAKNSSDWVDQQLLYYLADPKMFIITNDSKLQTRCKTSAQSSRVIVI